MASSGMEAAKGRDLARERNLAPERNGGFSPEFRLMLVCLRRPLGPPELALIGHRARGVRDWRHLHAVCTRHRVIGLVWRALQVADCQVPTDDAERFRQSFSGLARQAMLLSAESIRLVKFFSSADVDALFLKGVTVTMLAYGDATVRHAKDIDLLVPPEQIDAAVIALGDAGYRPMFALDEVSPERRQFPFRYAKSMDWVHARTGVPLELHWRLTDLPLLQGALPTDERQSVTIAPGRSLATLESSRLLAYLCVHGAAHGWMRLKWLADIYALLPHNDAAELVAVYREMERFGAGRPAGQALLLCQDLLGLPLEDSLLRELTSRASMRMLREFPPRLYARGDETAEVDDLSFGTTSVYLSRLLLGRGLHSLFSELRTWAYRPDELVKTRLPLPLLFLFPLIRVGSWLAGKVRYRGRSMPDAR